MQRKKKSLEEAQSTVCHKVVSQNIHLASQLLLTSIPRSAPFQLLWPFGIFLHPSLLGFLPAHQLAPQSHTAQMVWLVAGSREKRLAMLNSPGVISFSQRNCLRLIGLYPCGRNFLLQPRNLHQCTAFGRLGSPGIRSSCTRLQLQGRGWAGLISGKGRSLTSPAQTAMWKFWELVGDQQAPKLVTVSFGNFPQNY